MVDVERSPTLDFAETVEVKVVDSGDAMSVDSYFFASFPDNDYAFELLQTLLRERTGSQLPQVAPLPVDRESYQQDVRRQSTSQLSLAGLGNTVLRPFSSEPAVGSRVPIAPPTMPTLPQQTSDAEVSETDSSVLVDDQGYPPQQQGPPPQGMAQQPPGWSPEWIRKPASKLFASSPPGGDVPSPRPRPRRSMRKSDLVTEVVEPFVSSTDESGDESRKSVSDRMRSSRGSLKSTRSRRLPSQSDYSNMSDGGEDEDVTTHKFHTLFALPEREVLLDCRCEEGLILTGRLYWQFVSRPACPRDVLHIYQLLLLQVIDVVEQD